MSDEKRKLISIGDFLKTTDSIIEFELQNPTGVEGDMVIVPLRIKRANPKDSIKIMEFVNNKFGDKEDTVYEDNIDKMSPEQRTRAINLAYQYDATLISSCVYHPPENGVGIELDKNPKKVWEDADEVLDKCPLDLFDKLRITVGKQKMAITEAEAKK